MKNLSFRWFHSVSRENETKRKHARHFLAAFFAQSEFIVDARRNGRGAFHLCDWISANLSMYAKFARRSEICICNESNCVVSGFELGLFNCCDWRREKVISETGHLRICVRLKFGVPISGGEMVKFYSLRFRSSLIPFLYWA